METVEDSGFDSDHKTSASVPMAEELEQNKTDEVSGVIFRFLGNSYLTAVLMTSYNKN